MRFNFNILASYIHTAFASIASHLPFKVVTKTVTGQEIVIDGTISYPIPIRGIQPISLDGILAPNKERIIDLVRLLGLRSQHPKFNERKLIIAVVENFAKYVHLLPASEDYHHQTPGGLLAHSLDVAVGALRNASSKDLAPKGYPDEEAVRRDCYKYAVFISALLHDIGKVFSDMRVISLSGGEQWQPRIEPLTDWARRKKIERYKVEWIPERIHKKHESISTYVMHHLLPNEAKEYLLECKLDDMFHEIDSAIGFYSERKGYIYDSIRQADSISTIRSFSGDTDPLLGHKSKSLSSQLIRSIHRHRNKWAINESGGECWIINRQVYLLFPKTLEEIRDELLSCQVSVPSEIGVIMNIMVEQNIVSNPDPDTRMVFWLPGEFTDEEALRIQTNYMNGTDASAWYPLCRLKWYSYYFGDMPLPDSAPGILSVSKDGHMIKYSYNGDPFDMPALKSVKSETIEKPNIAEILQRKNNSNQAIPVINEVATASDQSEPIAQPIIAADIAVTTDSVEEVSSPVVAPVIQANTKAVTGAKAATKKTKATTGKMVLSKPKKTESEVKESSVVLPSESSSINVDDKAIKPASDNSEPHAMFDFIKTQMKAGVMLLRQDGDYLWINVTRIADYMFRVEDELIKELKDQGMINECAQMLDPLKKKAWFVKRGRDSECLLSNQAAILYKANNDDGIDLSLSSVRPTNHSLMEDETHRVYELLEKARLLNINPVDGEDIIDTDFTHQVKLSWIKQIAGNGKTGLTQPWIDSVKIFIDKKAYIEIRKQ